MEEELYIEHQETPIVFDTIVRDQDYAEILFRMSRYENVCNSMGESEFITICERAWCGHVAQYITELENKLHSLMKSK